MGVGAILRPVAKLSVLCMRQLLDESSPNSLFLHVNRSMVHLSLSGVRPVVVCVCVCVCFSERGQFSSPTLHCNEA